MYKTRNYKSKIVDILTHKMKNYKTQIDDIIKILKIFNEIKFDERDSSDYKIIVLEGVDCSGKDTISKLLAKETNFRVHVIRRLFITSLVYNSYFNRNLDQTRAYIKDLSIFVKLFSPLIIYLKCSFKTIKERLSKRGDRFDFINEINLKNLIKYYNYLFDQLKDVFNDNVLIIECDNLTPDKITEEILKHIYIKTYL